MLGGDIIPDNMLDRSSVYGMRSDSLCIKFGIEINYLEFLKGVENHKADRLSRLVEKGMSLEAVMEINGHSGANLVDLLDDPASAVLVEMCNPGSGLDSEDKF
jgi:hypothetical protein